MDDREAMRPVAEAEIEQSLRRYRLGDYRRAIHALRWCIAAELPLPDWVAAETQEAMFFYFENGGAKGRGRGGGHKKKLASSQMRMERYRIVAREYARQGNKNMAEACRRASDLLKGTPSRGEPREMKKSHDRVAAELAEAFAK